MSRDGKVLVAMSGGVDSSVAACLLKEQGYECVGVFMWVGEAAEGSLDTPLDAGKPADELPRLKQGCCSVGDACDARNVANRLGIPFYSLNFRAEFGRIIEYFVEEYAHARTPNPCVVCNTELKFGRLLQYADMVGAEFVATGHYARVVQHGGQACLAQAVNRAKDQSYVLFGVRRAALARCLFPIGTIADKSEVRRLAADLGLPVHDKRDSQEICFVPDQDYARLVQARRPAAFQPGEVRDAAGRVLGTHTGLPNYTIGQRHGLRIAMGQPVYVTKLDATSNTVTLGSRADLESAGLMAERVNWLTDAPATDAAVRSAIKIRHQHNPAPGQIRVVREGSVEACFDEPQIAVTPGQAAVFYDGEIVLGGGWITAARAARA